MNPLYFSPATLSVVGSAAACEARVTAFDIPCKVRVSIESMISGSKNSLNVSSLTFVLFFLFVSFGCSEDGGDPALKLGFVENEGTADCVPRLGVCLGDPILVYSFQEGTFKEHNITEFVPKGELSLLEKDIVKQFGPHVGPAWEKDFREAADRKGLRIFTIKGMHGMFEEYWGDGFKKIYRKKGCSPSGVCIGYQQMSWLPKSVGNDVEGRTWSQEVLGVALVDSETTPFLLKNTLNSSTLYSETKSGPLKERVVAEGCVKLSFSAQLFCVGETYYYNRVTGGTTHLSMSKQIVSYVTANPKKPAIILSDTKEGEKRISVSLGPNFSMYTQAMCAPGSKTLCLPDLLETPLLSRGFNSWSYQIYDFLAVRLPDMMDFANSAIVLRDSKGNYEFYSAEETKNLYVGAGCSDDDRICVGKQYKLRHDPLHPSQTVVYDCIGINWDQERVLLTRRKYDGRLEVNESDFSNVRLDN